jgi:hypothetical protein
MRPEITRLLPRKSKDDRHVRVEFVCPTCQKVHVMRLSAFDSITDANYPCPNRKKQTFKAWIDKQVDSLSGAQKATIREMLNENKAFSSIIRKFNLPHPAVLHAIVHPTRKPVEVPQPTVAASTTIIHHHYHAPVTHNIQAPSPKPAEPTNLMPKFPRMYSEAWNKLSKRDQLEANLAWHSYYKALN